MNEKPVFRTPQKLPDLTDPCWRTLADFSVPARIEWVVDVRDQVTQLARQLGLPDQDAEEVRLAVGEAYVNAVRHGSAQDQAPLRTAATGDPPTGRHRTSARRLATDTIGIQTTESRRDGNLIGEKRPRATGPSAAPASDPASDGEIHIRVMHCDTHLLIEVQDAGAGFEPDSIVPPDLGDLRPDGRGILFMRLVMDDVSFAFDDGTTVRMIKQLHRRSGAGS
jgi:anti-sigma regulatory factor (Ser/Thr protein kinase)